MVRDLREGIEAAKFNGWEMPVNQMGGIHLDAAQLPSSAVHDREGLRRLHDRLGKFPTSSTTRSRIMRTGMSEA